MKKTAFLMAFCIAAASWLAGCGQVQTTDTSTVRNTQGVWTTDELQGEAPTDNGRQTADVSVSAADNTSDATGTTVKDAASVAGKDTQSPATTAVQSDNASTQADTSAGTSTQAVSGKGTPSTTSGKDTRSTTSGKGAPSTTSGSGKVTTTVSGSANVSSPDKTTSASSTTAADKTTMTETTQIASDQAISGKLSYLNNAAVTYLPALNADDLKGFGITGDKQKEILKHKNDWTAYTIQIDFKNNTQTPLTIYYLDVTDNGKGNVYVCGDTAGELGMASGGKMSEKFFVLAKKDDSDIEVRQKLVGMSMRVQYAETPEDDSVTPNFKYSKIG